MNNWEQDFEDFLSEVELDCFERDLLEEVENKLLSHTKTVANNELKFD